MSDLPLPVGAWQIAVGVPGDALSIAQVVLTCRDQLGPAEEPEIVRALGMLELQRRRFVRDRQRELRKLKRINLGEILAQRTAARCIRELASDIDDLNRPHPRPRHGGNRQFNAALYRIGIVQ